MSAFDKKKTVTDMQFVELFQDGAAYKQAKLETWMSTQNAEAYNNSMFYWKKDYRGRYKERYLERSGYEPNTVATKLIIDPTALLTHIKTTNPSADEIITKRIMIPTIDNVSRQYLQDSEPTWLNREETITVATIEYKMIDIDYTTPTDDTSITVFFEGVVDDTMLHEIVFTNEFYAEVCLYVKYETTANDGSWFVLVEKQTTLPSGIYTEDDMTMTAIIPIKENGAMFKDDIGTRRLLNKMGLGGRSFAEDLKAEEGLTNGYIFTGLKFNTDNEYMAMALYRSFDYMRSTTGDTAKEAVNFNVSFFDLGYSFDVDIETKDGVATRTYSELSADGESVIEITDDLRVGQYSSELISTRTDNLSAPLEEDVKPNPGTTDSSLVLRWQIAPNTYNEMTITNYINTFRISGYDFTAYLDGDEEEGRLIIPLDVINGLKFREFIEVHERSFTMLAYSKQTVTIKWYQQSWFAWVVKAVFFIFTGGAGLALVDLLIDFAINMLISLAINELLKLIDNEIIRLIVSIAVTMGQGIMNGIDFTDFTIENYLPLANKVINGASAIYAESMKSDLESMKRTTEEIKLDELREEEQEGSFVVSKAMMDAHFSYSDMNSPDSWVRQNLGAGLFNFDQFFAVSAQLDTRVNVVSG